MAVLKVVSEEEIAEDGLVEYLQDLYRVVCVSERPASLDCPSSLIRTTYLVDWEQLVHLLEDYGGFGEDIVEVERISGDEATLLRHAIAGPTTMARA